MGDRLFCQTPSVVNATVGESWTIPRLPMLSLLALGVALAGLVIAVAKLFRVIL